MGVGLLGNGLHTLFISAEGFRAQGVKPCVEELEMWQSPKVSLVALVLG